MLIREIRKARRSTPTPPRKYQVQKYSEPMHCPEPLGVMTFDPGYKD